MDYNPPSPSDHGILQARTLEWVAISSFRGFSWPRYQTQVSCIAGTFFTVWVTREALVYNTSHTNNTLEANKRKLRHFYFYHTLKRTAVAATSPLLLRLLRLGSLGQPGLEMEIRRYWTSHSAAQWRPQKHSHLQRMHARDNVLRTHQPADGTGRGNARPHLWKPTAWSFPCRGLTV